MCSALRQNLPVAAGSFSCSRARCYTCSFLNSATSVSGPQSNFAIGRNFTCTSSIISCISCSKCCKLYIGETGRRLSDKFSEHFRSVRNSMMLTSLHVVRHFNTANHSISDIKVCEISPYPVVMIAVKDRKNVSFLKIGTIHPHGLNERFSFIWSLHSFCFCPACANKSGDFSPLNSLHCLCSSCTSRLFVLASALFTGRL